ncbi:hypothetical protein AAG570_008072 [Ranatra chinensis]|uniref:Cytohesin Ubiquitin Protein Inducing domain-containing protein n=1 Tax=Ranatra chinensis TaxID=642074 RepID=A0ABD0XTS2_9HEMI
MVASLQHKKEALEAKLRDKTSELKRLCIEEAELTGVLPAETPLEPGETPPQIRRRVRTAFTYPESLINKLRSKEDEALATLELECKIQTGIAEAALGLANDGTTSKSVRRKHRVLYQESQRRLSELETRLNTLRQVQPKHKKKPRPQTGLEQLILLFNFRFRSLDRSAQCFHHTENDNKTCYTLPRSVYLPHAGTVLLPSQTYPENSLMRTQSLGNMDSSKPQSDR